MKTPKRTKAHQIYKAKDGTRVPGVTTILGVLNKPALVPWANNLGLQGIKVRDYVDDKAAIGTLAHQMIEDYLRGVETDTSEYSKVQIEQAENSVLSFLEWEKSHPIEPILIEEPLVSEDWYFGGQIDCLAKLDGELQLIDFKTSKAVYPEMKAQCAAYFYLLQENGYEVESARILRIGRDEDEGFDDVKVSRLETRWGLFTACLSVYTLQRELKK